MSSLMTLGAQKSSLVLHKFQVWPLGWEIPKDAARSGPGFFMGEKIPSYEKWLGVRLSLCMVLMDKSYLKKTKTQHFAIPCSEFGGSTPFLPPFFLTKNPSSPFLPSAQFRPLSFLAQFPNRSISLKLPTSPSHFHSNRSWWKMFFSGDPRGW